MAQGCILGIDIGTSSLKTGVFDETLALVALSKQDYVHARGEVTAEAWWDAMRKALGELAERTPLSAIRCVSLSGYNALVGIDSRDRQVTPVVLYYNGEPSRHAHILMGPDEADFVYERTGNRLFANGMMATALRWLKDTGGGYDRAGCFLYSNGYIAARLTGRRTVDSTRASLSLLYDVGRNGKGWEGDLCALFGVDGGKLPKIFHPWEPVGEVSGPASLETGIPAGVPVLAGCMDSMCAALGCGILGAGQVLDIGGSAGGLAATAKRPVPHPRMYLVCYPVPGYWCNIGPLGASARLFHWFAGQYMPGRKLDAYFELAYSLPSMADGAQFLPYVGNVRHPYWKNDMKGHFLDLPESAGIAHMARAVVDGLGCAHRRVLDDILALGVRPSRIVAAGRDNTDEQWVKTKANFMKLPYERVNVREQSATGSAILAARYLGCCLENGNAARREDGVTFPCEDAPSLMRHEEYYRKFLEHCDRLYGAID